MKLTSTQFEKLSDLCIDLAKGMILAALAVPAITSDATIMTSLRALMLGFLFTYFSLLFAGFEEVKS